MKSFNKRIRKISKKVDKISPYFDSLNMVSHKIDSDTCGGHDHNNTINLKMFIILYFQNEIHVFRDSQIW